MNVRIRGVVPADAEALAHILITANRVAFQGLVPEECLTFTEAESAANWKRMLTEGLDASEFLDVVQTEEGRVVGYAWGGPSADDTIYRGELKQLSVLPAYQGQGLGRRLVRHVARRLAEKGLTSMRVSVLRINPNRAFYERLGARYVSEHPFDWDGVILPECVYGWGDTAPLLAEEAR